MVSMIHSAAAGRLLPKAAQAPVGLASRFDARGSLPPVSDVLGISFRPAGFVRKCRPDASS